MRTDELHYDLPDELIAQRPCEKRDASRLLVLDRATQTIRMDVFHNLARYLRAGDCLILNDTRVIPARLKGKRPSGGEVEVLLLRETAPGQWEALVRPSRRVKPGTVVRLGGSIEARVEEPLANGRRRVCFAAADVLGRLEEAGELPLPPYIRRDRPDAADHERYQTVYAQRPGAVAAPTAGLHFTPEVFQSLEGAGVRTGFLTLHVSYGTFRPIQTEHIEVHRLDPEEFDLPEETASLLNRTRAEGGRVVAVGTTCARVLETQYVESRYLARMGFTDRYIYPPYTFGAVDILQTNFHLPRSSLLALVCAFAGREFVMEAYRLAIRERFRFYSYGDVMLIL